MPIQRRQQPWAKGALALAALLILPVAGCKRAPASPSRPIAKGQQSHSEAAATAHEAARAPVQVPVQAPRFAVQVAAFDDRPSAEALASRLSDHFGLQTLVAPVESNGVTLYRVRLLVGSKDEADKLAETFQHTENLKVWIVPL
jgi:cell division protein FtsN